MAGTQTARPDALGDRTTWDRLDWDGDEQGPLLLIVGSAMLLGAIAAFIFGPSPARWYTSGVLGIVGWLLFRAGWRWPRSYATVPGLLRVRRGHQRLIPWTEVDVIECELDQDMEAAGDAIAPLTLRLTDGRGITIRTQPMRIHELAARIRRCCPQAFLDDRATGTISPPTEGTPEQIRAREAAVFGRARRGRTFTVMIWGIAGFSCAMAAVAVVFTAPSGGSFLWYLLAAVLGLAGAAAVGTAILTLRTKPHRESRA